MKIIVAADKKFAIGKDNKLLARIPHDLKRFKAITTGNVCIMGRNTYISLPVRPLPDRTTLLLTSKPEEFPEVKCFSSLEELMPYVRELEAQGEEVFVCGGEQVYRTLMPYCDKALVTKIMSEFEADTIIPSLDDEADWELVNETEEIETNGFYIKFVDYVNNDVRHL